MSNPKEKDCFMTHRGQYEFNRLPYGLANSPATFNMIMNEVIRDLNWKSALVYVDDILIYKSSFTTTPRLLLAQSTATQRSTIPLDRRMSTIARNAEDKTDFSSYSSISDFNKEFILHTDASGTAIGYVLEFSIREPASASTQLIDEIEATYAATDQSRKETNQHSSVIQLNQSKHLGESKHESVSAIKALTEADNQYPHPGIDRTYNNIRMKPYWKRMYSDIEDYVKTCIECQQGKTNPHSKRAPLQPLPATGVFEEYTWTFFAIYQSQQVDSIVTLVNLIRSLNQVNLST
ncbi:unnamed protein product [Mytilus edulis]|uniref:Reverse transcriptase domain-containing protein n=1 Tax=Mytilus edulis TaxID=6550 RepID=A0A8S3SYL7_MYTED|nr:unnamed protein product [Mytilus edulis]